MGNGDPDEAERIQTEVFDAHSVALREEDHDDSDGVDNDGVHIEDLYGNTEGERRMKDVKEQERRDLPDGEETYYS